MALSHLSKNRTCFNVGLIGVVMALTLAVTGCSSSTSATGEIFDGAPCTSDDFLSTVNQGADEYVCTEGPEGGTGELRWNIVGNSDFADTEVEQVVTGYDPLQLLAYKACVYWKGTGPCVKPQVFVNPNSYDAVDSLVYQKCVYENEYATSCGKPAPVSNPATYDPVQLSNYASCIQKTQYATSCSRPQPR